MTPIYLVAPELQTIFGSCAKFVCMRMFIVLVPFLIHFSHIFHHVDTFHMQRIHLTFNRQIHQSAKVV